MRGKFMTCYTRCRSKNIQFNYFEKGLIWNLYIKQRSRKYFYGRGFKAHSLLWYDNWLLGRSSRNLWLEEFFRLLHCMGKIKNLTIPFIESNLEPESLRAEMRQLAFQAKSLDKTTWSLSSSGKSTVRSFYGF